MHRDKVTKKIPDTTTRT